MVTHAMGEIFAGALLPSRVGAAILGSMALFGLLLASIGLYGVLLYATEQRIREIGIRVALGATPGDVLAMVAGQSLRLVAAGMAIGLAVAVVAGLATVAPTARALRVDPAVALRHEEAPQSGSNQADGQRSNSPATG